MKRMLVAVTAICFASLLLASNAFPWGSVTHAYVDDHLGLRGPGNLKELYGGMAPDLFNYLLNSNQAYLFSQTHGNFWTQAENFRKVWKAARYSPEKPYAYGFVSHNDLWGADFTAHHDGLFGQGTGYVIAKARILQPSINDLLRSLGLNVPKNVTLAIAEGLVETGVDILVKRKDPSMGVKVSASALLRGSDFPPLLVKAYAAGFAAHLSISQAQAAQLITSSEMEFRKMMILYGQALGQDEATAIDLIAQQLAQLAVGFLAAYGIPLPPGTDLTPQIKPGIQQAMSICASDYLREIEATIHFVENQLLSHGISY